MRIGWQLLTRSELKAARAAGRRLRIDAIGVLHISPTVDRALAEQTIDRIRIKGRVSGPRAVLKGLGDRIVKV